MYTFIPIKATQYFLAKIFPPPLPQRVVLTVLNACFILLWLEYKWIYKCLVIHPLISETGDATRRSLKEIVEHSVKYRSHKTNTYTHCRHNYSTCSTKRVLSLFSARLLKLDLMICGLLMQFYAFLGHCNVMAKRRIQ